MDELNTYAATHNLATEVTPERVRAMQHQVKEQWGWSARAMAEQLGISRSHLKRIEMGERGISDTFRLRFERLEKEYAEFMKQRRIENAGILHITCKFKLPDSFEILAKPRRCKGCRKWFVPVTPNQKMHNADACKRAARRNRKSNRRGTQR